MNLNRIIDVIPYEKNIYCDLQLEFEGYIYKVKYSETSGIKEIKEIKFCVENDLSKEQFIKVEKFVLSNKNIIIDLLQTKMSN